MAIMDLLIATPLTRFIAQVVAIVALSRLIGLGVRRLGQPMVIAEITAGILLGPSLLGWLFPDAFSAVFAPRSLGLMSTVSHIGLVLFMFLIGLELDHRMLRGRGRASLVISYTGIAVPFALAVVLSLYLYPRLAGQAASFATFALFMGASMSVTAFPVLARILAERQLVRSQLGALAVACAAIDDVTAWCFLAFAVAAARSAGLTDALFTTALAVTYVSLMMFAVRPLLVKLAARVATPERMTQNVVAAVLLLLLLSSWTTELIGIHALFGAFLFGAILPKDGGFARALVEKLEGLVVIVLVPLFFAFSGLRTEIGLLYSGYHWGICGLIVAVATLGKAGGGALAARLSGLSWRESGALGVLMNTRGLMGVIVLNIGLDLGVISTTLFSMMVIMALVTTIIATPLLEWIYPARDMARDLVESLETLGRPAPNNKNRVLVCVSRADSAAGLIHLAHALVRGQEHAPIDVLHVMAATDPPSLHVTDGGDDGVPDALRAAIATADQLGIEIKPLSFVSPDPAQDICRIASVRETGLVLLASPAPDADQPLIDDLIGAVLSDSASTIAVLVDRGFTQPHNIVVPRHGSANDRAALSLARRLAGSPDVTVIDVPGWSAIAESTANGPVEPQLVVLGVGRELARGSRAAETLVRECRSSLVLVRGSEHTLAMAAES